MDAEKQQGVDLNRRAFLKRGAAIAGAVWAVPTIQVLSMSAAQASGGGPPKPSGIGGSPPSFPSKPSGPSLPGSSGGGWPPPTGGGSGG